MKIELGDLGIGWGRPTVAWVSLRGLTHMSWELGDTEGPGLQIRKKWEEPVWGVWQEGDQDFGGTQGRGGWSINKEDESGWGGWHRPDHGACIAGYSVMFDFDSKRGQSYGRTSRRQLWSDIHFSRSSFWVLCREWILEGQE